MNAPPEPVIGREIGEDRSQSLAAVVERMRLYDQVVVLRCAARESAENDVEKRTLRREARVIAEIGVMRELAENDVIGKAAPPHPPCRKAASETACRKRRQMPEIEPEFAFRSGTAMRPIARIPACAEQKQSMIGGAPEDVLPDRAPSVRRVPEPQCPGAQCLGHLVRSDLHEGRGAVRAASLVGDPVGPEIALFEDVNRHARPRRRPAGFRVDRPARAVADQIGYPVLRDPVADRVAPRFGRAVEARETRQAPPEHPVAQGEADSRHLGAARDQAPRQSGEERPVRTLKEKEAARRHGNPHIARAPRCHL